MGSFSMWHWLIVLVVILIVFGAGKLPKVAGDLALGIKNFKKGMQDHGSDPDAAQAQPAQPAQPRTIEGATPVNGSDQVASRDKATQG